MANLTREQNATPENDNNTRCPSSSTYGSASSNTIAPTPNLTNTFDNMTKPSAHTSNDSPTPCTTSTKLIWWQEDYNANQWQEETRGIAVHNTRYWAPEGNTTLENDNNNLFPPSPPNEPAPTFTRTPAPPPDEQQDEDGLPDEKGITMHKDRWQYKVILRCTYCHTQYTTRWGAGQEPYQELTDANWQRGRDGSGNKTWQRARCPDYYQGCGGDGNRQVVQGQLALQY